MAESSDGGRGGSSTLPHKRNPVGATLTIACAQRVRGAASVLTGALRAGARASRGRLAGRVGGAARRAGADRRRRLRRCARRWRASGRPDRMRANLELTGGLLMTEAVSTALAARLGRAEAKNVVAARGSGPAAARAPLLAEPIEPSTCPPRRSTAALDPADYLGSAPTFVDRALKAHEERR